MDTQPPPTPHSPVQGETSSDEGVIVHLYAAARAAAKVDALRVAAGSLAEVLASCERAAPGLVEVLPRCSYLRNGLAVSDEEALLAAGDRLDVLPPFAGG